MSKAHLSHPSTPRASLREALPELAKVEGIIGELRGAHVEVLGHAEYEGERLPIHAIRFGPEDAETPVLGIFAGVHGLERVGTQLVLAHLQRLAAAVRWDSVLRAVVERIRILFVPLVNPVGMALGRRANGNGVDLMRNAPVDAEDRGGWYQLYRGQRWSARLPWYRGAPGQPMQREARVLCRFVRERLFPSRFAVTLDVHSGFAGKDRLWFPYARTRSLFPHAAEMVALRQLLGTTHRHHRYVIEPQAVHYTTHGDLWDYLYDARGMHPAAGMLLPLTLELSATAWYTKNPQQLLSRVGFFHPVKPHRLTRVLRRHDPLLDFLARAVVSHEAWLPTDPHVRNRFGHQADLLWTASGRRSRLLG